MSNCFVTEEPRKAFSWADLASKGTRGPVSQMPAQSAPQSTKPAPGFGPRQEIKQDTSPTAPKEQRAPRYKFILGTVRR